MHLTQSPLLREGGVEEPPNLTLRMEEEIGDVGVKRIGGVDRGEVARGAAERCVRADLIPQAQVGDHLCRVPVVEGADARGVIEAAEEWAGVDEGLHRLDVRSREDNHERPG